MLKRKIQRKLLSYVLAIVMVLSIIAPADVINAAQIAGVQKISREKDSTVRETEENLTDSQQMTESELEQYKDYDGILEDTRTVFDNINSKRARSRVSNSNKKQIVNDVVVFIRFADEPENIYEQKGGYDYIKSQFTGESNSLAANLDEFSWGQVSAQTYFYPEDKNGKPICYVDDKPVNYYKKKSDSNPDGYSGSAEKSSRRSELLSKVKSFMGEDFEKKLGIEGSLYNLTFFVPDEEEWNDLLWSHKSSIIINNKWQVYNFITYPYKKDKTRTICHEFMHSLGFPDMYHYYSNNAGAELPLEQWSIMAYTGVAAGHPTVYEKQKYGNWIQNENAIKEITQDGQYCLGPATASQDNTLAYKIPVPGSNTEYFMIEYRGSDKNSFDANLGREGLIFYRVNTEVSGNPYGPPDEVFVLRNKGMTVANAYFDGSSDKKEFSNFKLYNSEEDLGIKVHNINKKDGKMYFTVDLDTVRLTPSTPSGTETQNVTFTAATRSAANLQYQFLVDGTVKRAYSTNPSFTWKCEYRYGGRKIAVNVKDTTSGKVIATKEINYQVNQAPSITGIGLGSRTPKVGDTFNILVSTVYGTGNLTKKIEVQPENGIKTTIYDGPMSSDAKWTPTRAGNYTIYVTVQDENKVSATGTLNCVIGSSGNAVNVYYANSAWNNAYIHYKVGNGAWTTVPGVKMNTSSEKSGYTWKYTIDLESESNATVCFNNGNGSWDSKNGANYIVKAGNTGIKNGAVTVLEGVNPTIKPTVTPTAKPELQITLEADKVSPIKTGTSVKFIGNSPNELYHRYNNHIFSVTRQGDSSNNTKVPGSAEDGITGYCYTWTPTEAGTYTITYETIEYSGRSAKKSMTFVVAASSANVANVYYYNNSYSNAYIHYRVGNGAWTTVPGVKMSTSSEQSGYTWKYTIDLGSESNATVCFNNGNGSWDSKNGANYIVKAGNTGIKNGAVTVLGGVNPTIKPTVTPTVKPTIKPTTTPTHVVEVYYANSAWNNAYIHYKVGNGAWTTVPGVKMSTSSEQSGYTWKYTIDLGSETTATVCFNNGNNLWDSRNGANYTVSVGTYGIKNQQASKLNSNNNAANNISMTGLENMASDMTVAKSIGAAYRILACIKNGNQSQNY